jgi:hypothetical protein
MRLSAFNASLAAAALILSIPDASAQGAYPAKPVTVIVPFQAGHGVDVMARALATELARVSGASAAKLHQRVVFLGRRDFDRRLRADNEDKAQLVRALNLKAE